MAPGTLISERTCWRRKRARAPRVPGGRGRLLRRPGARPAPGQALHSPGRLGPSQQGGAAAAGAPRGRSLPAGRAARAGDREEPAARRAAAGVGPLTPLRAGAGVPASAAHRLEHRQPGAGAARGRSPLGRLAPSEDCRHRRRARLRGRARSHRQPLGRTRAPRARRAARAAQWRALPAVPRRDGGGRCRGRRGPGRAGARALARRHRATARAASPGERPLARGVGARADRRAGGHRAHAAGLAADARGPRESRRSSWRRSPRPGAASTWRTSTSPRAPSATRCARGCAKRTAPR